MVAADGEPCGRGPGRGGVLHQQPQSAARRVAQLEENVAALGNLDLTDDELSQIDEFAVDSGINLWASSSSS